MNISITFEHADIVGVDATEFGALFHIIGTYAKMTRGILPSDEITRNQREALQRRMKKVFEETDFMKKVDNAKAKNEQAIEQNAEKPAEKIAETPEASPAKNPVNRKDIETAIKQIASDGREKGASKKIKEIIQSYGVEKLSEVPDEKMAELLAKVQESV